MAFALVAHTSVAGAGASTTPAVDTTGANLLVASLNSTSSGPHISDSKGNTWTQISTEQAQNSSKVSMYYSVPSSVGSGHTFTSDNLAFGCFQIVAFSGASATPLDQSSGGTGNQPGSVTPTEDNELLVTGYGEGDGGVTTGNMTVNGGFTRIEENPYNSGVSEGGAIAYLIQTSLAAANPTWTPATGGAAGPAIIATFKATATADTLMAQICL